MTTDVVIVVENKWSEKFEAIMVWLKKYAKFCVAYWAHTFLIKLKTLSASVSKDLFTLWSELIYLLLLEEKKQRVAVWKYNFRNSSY